MLAPTLAYLSQLRVVRSVLLVLGMVAAVLWAPRLALAGDVEADADEADAGQGDAPTKRASYRYVHMTAEEAFAELDRRGVPYAKVDKEMSGVLAPVRLTGELHGVHIHSSLPEEKRATSAFEILDARLALALDDFAALLARHDIVEVVHFTMYRPNGLKPGTEHEHAKSEEKTASKKKTKGSKRSKKTRSAKKSTKKGSAKKKPTLGKGDKRSKKHASRSSKRRRAKQKNSDAKKKKATRGKKGRSAKKTAKTPKKRSKKTAKAPKKRSKKTAKKRSKKTAKKRSKKTAKASKKRSKNKDADEPVKTVAYSPPGTRHPAGLAIDVGGFRKRDGRWIGVAQHFGGKIGRTTCGRGTSPANTSESRELWSIACESVELGMFTYVLTPNYDKAHFDHFHMEIRPQVEWSWVK